MCSIKDFRKHNSDSIRKNTQSFTCFCNQNEVYLCS